MNSKSQRVILGTLIAVLLFFAGCIPEKVLNKNTRYFLPEPPEDSYRTDPFKQWVELKDIFNNESAVVIIHCKGTVGVVGEWATQALCWAKMPGDVSYDSIVIETYGFYAADSGPKTTERRYWPVDINNDSVEDIFVLEWGHGEKGIYDDPSRREAYNEPMGVRVIVRKEHKGWPWGIESDTEISWQEVEKNADKYRKYIKEAQKVCKDEQWQKRIERAIYLLK